MPPSINQFPKSKQMLKEIGGWEEKWEIKIFIIYPHIS
jgi:hypothetical protein